LLAEESGRLPIARSRKTDDTAQKMLERALRGRGLKIEPNELNSMAKISHALDVWYVMNILQKRLY
jgi:hypothetical protein